MTQEKDNVMTGVRVWGREAGSAVMLRTTSLAVCAVVAVRLVVVGLSCVQAWGLKTVELNISVKMILYAHVELAHVITSAGSRLPMAMGFWHAVGNTKARNIVIYLGVCTMILIGVWCLAFCFTVML